MNSSNHSFSFGAHGLHRAWTEGDDIVHIVWSGDVSAEDVTTGAKAFELVPNRERGFILILHVGKQGRFTSEARKAISADPRSGWVRDIVVVGASFHVRVMLGMVTKAVAALGVGKASIGFVESEAVIPEYAEKLRRKWKDKR